MKFSAGFGVMFMLKGEIRINFYLHKGNRVVQSITKIPFCGDGNGGWCLTEVAQGQVVWVW